MESEVPQLGVRLLDKLRLTRIHSLDELETGTYWPQLQPYFTKPQFRRLTYHLIGRGPRDRKRGEVLSTRGAGGLGDFDIAYVADRHATVLSITEAGLPDYCITLVDRGALEYRSTTRADPVGVGGSAGLIYRGLPGTRLHTTDDNGRLAIWIAARAVEQRLAALLGEPGREDLTFVPTLDWESAPGQGIMRLVWLLTQELASPHTFAPSALASRSFEDLLLYSLLQSLPHNHTNRLARATGSPVPGTVRRAEEFIRSRAGQPVALHEVADAAGCSVRALQLGFRQFRDTTPAAAIRQARLEAVQQALARGEAEGTVTAIAHQYGFTNPGRFTRLYTSTFGKSPAEALRRNPLLRSRR